MNKRRFGRTGVEISEVGYGGWGIGGSHWIGATDDESRRALHRAIDLGLNFIDTALGYGRGHSEKVIGTVLRERREEIFVATKVPPANDTWPARKGVPASVVFPARHVRRSCDESLRNLRVERLDLLQLHVWLDDFLEESQWRDALLDVKKAGKVRWLGISVNDHSPRTALRAVASGLFDSVQVIYNIYDPTPADELFPVCRQHDVGVIVRVPFDEGGLLGTITPDAAFPAGDFRGSYFKGDRRRLVFEHTESLKRHLGSEASTLPELALRFCLSHDAVSTVIPGMRRTTSVEANAAVSDGRALSPDLLAELREQAWPRNYYS
jgi:aryl-alcohol dehydrogenase-like predicted oxidoreductase